jgi:hypothetical protein
MARKKARLTENDPLESKTDSILSSFSSKQQVNKSKSREPNNSTSQKVNKPIRLKKATYKLSEDVIERLDRAYLQMSLERGRQNTPYKEVLVEEAIALFLDQLEQNPDLVEQVDRRQDERG